MVHTTITRHFDAPVEQVWDLAMDLPRWPKWFPGLIEVRDIRGPTDQVGTTALLVMKGPDKVRTLRLQLSQIDHLRLHAHTAQEVDGPMTSTSTMRLTPAAGGTDLVWEQDLSLGGLFGAVLTGSSPGGSPRARCATPAMRSRRSCRRGSRSPPDRAAQRGSVALRHGTARHDVSGGAAGTPTRHCDGRKDPALHEP